MTASLRATRAPLRSALLVGLLATLAPACAASDAAVEDELAGVSPLDDTADAAGAADAKADRADGVSTYFELRADLRRCAAPRCGGYTLARLNRTTAVCADGTSQASCYVAELDWSKAGLSDKQVAKLTGLSRSAAARPAGVLAVVRGRVAAKTFAGAGNLGQLQVIEAWVATGAGVSDGVFVKATDTGARCIAAPCADKLERLLNGSRSAQLAELGWDALGASDDVVSGLIAATFREGVILSGARYTVTEGGRTAKGRTAVQAFRQLLPGADAPCYVGGCSSEICSDQQGAVSSCVWRPEYACYRKATCARQDDATCEWNLTPAVETCLASPPAQ